MVYIPFNPAKPEGADTPPIYADDDLANIRGLRDAVVSGFMPGWSFSAEASDYPAWWKWRSGALGFRLTWGYSGGYPNNIVSALWEYTENNEAAWAIITTGGTPVSLTLAPYGRVLTADKDAGSWLAYVFANNFVEYLFWQSDEHAAGIGAAVHGLGTMSTQNYDNVAISGGVVAGVKATGLTRLAPAAPPNIGAGGIVVDWAAVPTQLYINAGGTITGFANAVGGEMKRIVVLGGGAITLNPGAGNGLAWGIGHPVWGPAYTIINVICIIPNTFFATTIPV